MRCAWPWQGSPVAFERIFGKLIARSTDFCTHTFSCLLHDALPRDMVEYKGRVESYSREVLRKESQIKELQGRIDTGDGCEYFPFKTFFLKFLSFSRSSRHSFGKTSNAAFHAFGSVLTASSILT